MKGWPGGVLLGVLALLTSACGGGFTDSAVALTSSYYNDFEGTDPLAGWLFYDAIAGGAPSPTTSTLWHVDGTDPAMPGLPYKSPVKSLNYNKTSGGYTYDTGSHNAGAAISPKIDLSVFTTPVLSFWCNYKTETTGTSFDKRTVKVGYLNSSGTVTTYIDEVLSETPGSSVLGPCSPMGTWHLHVVPLSPSFGKVRVAFGFDTVDAFFNDYPGWFVDNVFIGEAADDPNTTSSGSGTSGGGSTGGTTGGTSGGSTGGTSGGSTGGGTTGGGTTGGSTGGTTGGTSGGSTGGTSGGSTGGGTTGGGTTGGSTGGTTGGTSGGSTGGGTTGGGTTGGTGAGTPVYTTDFGSPTASDGWTFSSTAADVKWSVDATPATVLGADSFKSAPTSLNYNNGTNFKSVDATGASVANAGTATSPAVSLDGTTNPRLVFWCNFHTETEAATGVDKRILQISKDNFATNVLQTQLSVSSGGCSAMGTWHQHVIPLDTGWGIIRIRFLFDSGDGNNNEGAGWFIDDVQIVADAVAPGATAGVVSGSSGGSVLKGGGHGGALRCYVASASFGSVEPVLPIVDLRERFVKTNGLGSVFVAAYESASPRPAESVRGSAAMQVALTPVSWFGGAPLGLKVTLLMVVAIVLARVVGSRLKANLYSY